MRRSYSDEQLIIAVKNSITKIDILKRLGLKPSGGNYNILDIHIARLGLDMSHVLGRSRPRTKLERGGPKTRSYDDILVQSSTYSGTNHLKNRLIKDGILSEMCNICGINNWQGKSLKLHLDHINGNRRDHRLENLRLLCPNCHSQTPTYCRKNMVD